LNLIKYLMHLATWQKLPKPPRAYSSEYELKAAGDDIETMMKLSHIRCPQGAEHLTRKHGLPVRELIDRLPRSRYRRMIKRRLVWLICRATGTTPYDPMKRRAFEHRKRSR
jgi:hypothetical protein